MAKQRRNKEEPQKVVVVGQENQQPEENINQVVEEPVRLTKTFESWWAENSYKRGLKPQMKDAIKKHFESRGYMDNLKFDEGLIDFGIKT